MGNAYTTPVEKGEITDLEAFAMRCARAVGYMVSMRDSPLDAELPLEVTENPDYALRVEYCREKLRRLESLSDSEIEAECTAFFFDSEQDIQRRKIEDQRERDRLLRMLDKVRKWVQPTPDHDGLKDFMREQIWQALEWNSSEYRHPPLKRMTDREWHEHRVSDAIHWLAVSESDLAAERKRVAETNEWLRALRESLREEERET